MTTRHLLFVRHGDYRSTADPENEPDGPLTQKGIQQAKLIAARLNQFPIQVIHHSTMVRTVETAEPILKLFKDAEVRPSDYLRECVPNVPKELETHFSHIPETVLKNGPIQAETAFSTYIQPIRSRYDVQYEVLVSHGNLINYIACQSVNAPKESWLNFDIQHCGLTEIVIDSDGFIKLTRHNDVGHLPLELQSFQ